MRTLLTRVSPGQLDAALLILRVVVGVVFIAHGAQKLFTFGIPGVQSGFADMGIPLPSVTAVLITALEFGGGIALVLGLLTRLIALLLAFDMLGAILLVHLPAGFFLPQGYEFALTLLGAALAITLAGPGAWAVDALLGRGNTAAD
jgi:putative oxidoreductase